MRISYWSSDVCSSDLSFHCIFYFKNDVLRNCNRVLEVGMNLDSSKTKGIGRVAFRGPCMHKGGEETPIHPRQRIWTDSTGKSLPRWKRTDDGSEGRRVGNEGVCPCRTGGRR